MSDFSHFQNKSLNENHRISEPYMDKLLEYNSGRSNLKMPEYGRHVQKLIKHAREISDTEQKQAIVERIVELMAQDTPQNKNVADYQERLWNHLFRIAKFDLDGIQVPEGIEILPDDDEIKPVRVSYPKSSYKFRHYGYYIQAMIDKAIDMEDGEIKEGFVQTIGYYMKLAYKNWNRNHYVNDEVIKEDLLAMGKGKIDIPEAFTLDHQTVGYHQYGQSSKSSYSNNNRRKHKRKSNASGFRKSKNRNPRG